MVIQGVSSTKGVKGKGKGIPSPSPNPPGKMSSLVGSHNGSGGSSGVDGLIISVGTQVNIKRTDGRVHTALVSSVNWETRSVTVEWFEKNETKGKEMDLGTIVELNPHILPVSQQPNKSSAQLPAPSASSTMNNTTNNTARSNTADSQFNNLSSKVQQNVGLKPPGAGRIPQRQPNNRQTVIAPSALPAPLPVLNSIKDKDEEDMDTGGTVGRETMAVNARRRSNVVKEVEKLKKDREARRQKQIEIKTEKENLMEPGNPHWEFSTMIKEYRQGLELAPLKENDIVEDHQITVCVRKRPMNKKELNRKEVDVITVPNKNQISVHEPKSKVDLTKYLENQHFRFDYAFDESCTNETVYRYTARPLVKTIFDGGMATCFAYGQTGSGKTHTMGGTFTGKTQDCISGIYAMTAKDVFHLIKGFRNLSVGCSFFEIYSGKVFDLLAQKARLRVLEDGKQQVQVVGLTERVVTCVDDVLKLITVGNSARTSGQTSANSNSSRSHAVFQIILRNGVKCHGKFSLIDLAGNERGADTSSADRQTRMEGAEINKSLLALKECIRALGRKGAHLPFRASKLTQVLRDSFIGEKSKTCMIAMISPGLSSCEHSLNTLRYADRVKELAATDPMEIRAIDENMEDDDETEFQQLASLNENDMSSEMLTFHEVMSKLQEAEDEMVEHHKCMVDANSAWASKDIKLLNLTNQVEWDQELYATQLDALLDEKIDMINEMKIKIQKFRTLAKEEEFASKQVSSHNLRK